MTNDHYESCCDVKLSTPDVFDDIRRRRMEDNFSKVITLLEQIRDLLSVRL